MVWAHYMGSDMLTLRCVIIRLIQGRGTFSHHSVYLLLVPTSLSWTLGEVGSSNMEERSKPVGLMPSIS